MPLEFSTGVQPGNASDPGKILENEIVSDPGKILSCCVSQCQEIESIFGLDIFDDDSEQEPDDNARRKANLNLIKTSVLGVKLKFCACVISINTPYIYIYESFQISFQDTIKFFLASKKQIIL